MFKTFNTDRKAIERKYHNPDEEFNPFNRMAYHGYGYDENTGLSDTEILEGLKNLEPMLTNLPHPVARAKAIEYVLENTRIYVNEHDYFVGLYSLNRLANSVTKDKWVRESEALRNGELLKLSSDFNRSGAVAIWTDYDHVVPDWRSVMELGFVGLRERARAYRMEHVKNKTLTEEKSAFFEGIEIEYTAIINLLDRMYKYAVKQKNGKSEKIAKCLKSLRDGAPADIYEAMQLIFLYFIISESIDCFQVRSLGNGLDNTLYSFYKNDLQSGTYSRDEIKEFLAYFLMQWSAIGNYWGQPFYLGGTAENGGTKYNDLSFDILDVYESLEIYNPKIQLKVNLNTPDWVLNKAFQMIKKDNSSLVFCCEPGMIKAVMGYGASFEEALNMDIRGCYETGVRANEVCSSSGYINAAKAVEYVFTNGFDKNIKQHVGLKTGELSEIKSFDDFYFAFIKQWEYLIEKSIAITDDAERFLSFVNPSSMYSATIEGSLKKGFDAYQGGVKFNNNAVLNCSFATAVDSVMAVYEFVYDKKELTLSEFKEALDANWEGYETLRGKVHGSSHKYGNGDELADKYARAMADYFANKVNNVPNARGGVNKAILHSARQFLEQGKKTFATPDGRKQGEELSKNASPSVGMDKNGVTALLKSAINLNPYNFHESFCIDIMLHPSSIEGEDGLCVLKSLLHYYIKNDGMSLQFNIFNAEILRDAQKNPEKYRNLQVRVCGWNVLWNNLGKKEQDAYILRAENIQ